MFDKFIGYNTKLGELDQEMLSLARENGIENAVSIDHYGIEGLVGKPYYGVSCGEYYYGDENNFIGLAFAITIDRSDLKNSDIMLSTGILVKEGKVIVKKELFDQ